MRTSCIPTSKENELMIKLRRQRGPTVTGRQHARRHRGAQLEEAVLLALSGVGASPGRLPRIRAGTIADDTAARRSRRTPRARSEATVSCTMSLSDCGSETRRATTRPSSAIGSPISEDIDTSQPGSSAPNTLSATTQRVEARTTLPINRREAVMPAPANTFQGMKPTSNVHSVRTPSGAHHPCRKDIS